MLTLDYANCLSPRVGDHGLDPALLTPGAEPIRALADHTRSLAGTRGTGWERWRNLPFDPMRREHVSAVKAAAASCRGQFETLVVLGIGGSALGNIAVHSALTPPTWNLLPASARGGPRLFVLDNVDPSQVGAVLDFCAGQPGGLRSTLFNVISKSGETAETAAQFMIIRDRLKTALGPNYAGHVVAITDPAKGTMRQICNAEGYVTLPVPEGVGGRFSVLSPVGLFSAAMCGVDIDALLDGAAAMDARCADPDPLKNPAALLAFLLCTLGTTRGKTIHVMMPYCNALYLMADWYRQLWAESLGKRVDRQGREVFTGFTPIKALGATDQHSQVQLYREGPNDKVFGFLEVEAFERDITIPAGLGVPALAYLEAKPMSVLLNAEKRATEYAFVESRRPNYTIRFPRLDARHVGEFIQLWQVATAYAGLMLNIDAYDQPAVETGKVATFGLMGRSGYEKHLTQVTATLTPTPWVV
ncbi:MAG: glucose-6-phosphate isomerase [Phycisphaerae bacterium]|nr:MAG: glucose-6-phosphate isomerase [Phycisphaerae bacterium]